MTLKLQGSTSGHTAIEAPASAGSNTIILPANNGSANQYLKNSATAGTLEWGGAGKVVGFKIATSSTNEQNTSGNQTWTLVGPVVTHTAASSNNKLLLLHNHHLMIEDMHWNMALYRDGTSGTKVYEMQNYVQSAIWMSCIGIPSVTLDAPDTSSHTYQFAIYRDGGADNKIRYSPNSASTGAQIILLELAP